MKFSRIIVKDYQQFKYVDIDLTYPCSHRHAGKPLEAVCLIGKNGTGKTTLLTLLVQFLTTDALKIDALNWVLKLEIDEAAFYIITSHEDGVFRRGRQFYSVKIDDHVGWVEDFKKDLTSDSLTFKYDKYLLTEDKREELRNKIVDRKDRLLVYSPSEASNNELLNTAALPSKNLNDALVYFDDFPYLHNVSFNNVKGFWNTVIFQVKKRESDYQEYFQLKENKHRTIAEVEIEFNKKHPPFLTALSSAWDRILEKAGLYFDVKAAIVPVQLKDNLQAYIKLKSTDETIAYSNLSSGIRHYIFRLGYISSLFFRRKIKNAIALIDEPENSLFPDLLYDLVDQYKSITMNTQFFFATHSPIIAAQFEPCERIILDFDDFGNVTSKKGSAPIGDDPNDLLIYDFGIESLLGKEGKAKWERYVELKILIKGAEETEQKEKLVQEFIEIGNRYNFNETSRQNN
jgi:predicted ATP-dependent endonuclease of OLD family